VIRRTIAIALAIMAGLALLASPASAASVHLKGGANAEPSFLDTGLSLTASGKLAGLGNAPTGARSPCQAAITAGRAHPRQSSTWGSMTNGSRSSVPQSLHRPSVAGVTPSHRWQKMTRGRGVVISHSPAKWL